MDNKFRKNFIIVGSLMALVLGMGAGIVLGRAEVAQHWVDGFDLLGKLWVNALMVLVIPLVMSYLVYTVLSMASAKTLGKIGAYALLVHTSILLSGIVYSLIFSFFSLEIFGDFFPALAISAPVSQDASVAESMAPIQHGLDILNLMLRMIGKAVLILVFVAVVWAAIVARFAQNLATRLQRFTRRFSEKSMKWLGNYLLSLPFAVFALSLPMAANTGKSF